MTTILKGKGFVLRHIRIEDADGYFECRGDKKLKPFLLKICKSSADAKKELKLKIADFSKKKPFGETFAIEVDGEFAGYVELHNLNQEHSEHKCEIGYSLRPKFRGRGIMAKAVKILTDYAFKKYKLKRISAMGRAINKASARTLEKAGYKLEGILKNNKCVDGKYYDDFLYARVR